jgi:hypothetical protein
LRAIAAKHRNKMMHTADSVCAGAWSLSSRLPMTQIRNIIKCIALGAFAIDPVESKGGMMVRKMQYIPRLHERDMARTCSNAQRKAFLESIQGRFRCFIGLTTPRQRLEIDF